jgi:hypothetical protein
MRSRIAPVQLLPSILLLALMGCHQSADSPTAPASPSVTTIALAGKATPTYSDPGQFTITKYGNWCGGDWGGGYSRTASAIDRLDTACRNHDNTYAAANAKWSESYKAAPPSSTTRLVYCRAWIEDYSKANSQLVSAAKKLPALEDLRKSMERGDTPDAWNYDSRIYGPHRQNAGQRVAYVNRLKTASVLNLFYSPNCIPYL